MQTSPVIVWPPRPPRVPPQAHYWCSTCRVHAGLLRPASWSVHLEDGTAVGFACDEHRASWETWGHRVVALPPRP